MGQVDVKVRLSKTDVFALLQHFDDSSDRPLHEGLDFDSYSEKLSNHAFFVLYHEEGLLLAFIAYYLNYEENFVYIPQIVVHKKGRHQGVGHQMIEILEKSLPNSFKVIRLEVLKENIVAYNFYMREGFSEVEDRNERFLLEKKLIKAEES